MGKRRKWLAATALVIGIPTVGAFLYAETLTRRTIEEGARAVLGVEVSVGFVRLGFLGGGVELFDLAVRNPVGFGEPDLLRVGHADISVWLPGLLADRVEIPALNLRDVRVDLERRGETTNYGRVLANLNRDKGLAPQGLEPHTHRTVVIQNIHIREIAADIRMLPEMGAIPGAQELTGLQDIKVQIPELVLRDVTSRGDSAQIVGRLTDVVAAAILESIARHATNLPGVMVDEFASVGGSLGSTSLQVVGKVTQIGGQAVGDTIADAFGQEAGDVARTAANSADEAAQGVAHFIESETQGSP